MPGARGPTGLKESELNLKVAVAAAQLLHEQGVPTLLTRTGDYYIELDERIALGDAANATALVSIHHNAPIAAKSNTPGTEVFAQTGDTESARLAGLLHKEVFEVLNSVDGIQWTSRWDAGALRVVNSERWRRVQPRSQTTNDERALRGRLPSKPIRGHLHG
ncbi:MAG: N-acetylmuramoyl-L-alanine amidase [Candidatus Poriferisodalaceae bacterium]